MILKYLFEIIPVHMDDKELCFLKELLTCSEKLPESYRKTIEYKI